jgi:tryptophan synthase alpha chain
MNRIEKACQGKKAFITFVTGGDPDIETTEKLIVAMAESGADIIEIGIPFSDPISEGPVIQAADERALANGCTVDQLFAMVKRLRKKIDIPLLFMTYVNPIFVYGKERFMENCTVCGIDGVIVPDLPFEERAELAEECARHDITQISMIAPTSQDRIKQIAQSAEGFLYCVSSLGVTGMRSELDTNVAKMIELAKETTSIPCAIGFGISTPEQAHDMAAISDGVIIGSAIVRLVAEHGRESMALVRQFVGRVKAQLGG